MNKASCNICGGTKFKLGPGGRLSITKLPPLCQGCGSLERHRVLRSTFDRIRNPKFKKFNALIFTKDLSVAGGWFGSVHVSVPGSRGAIDVQKIKLEDRSVDVIVCNHVLTNVPDYKKALNEITRVISDRGFAFISFSNPHFRAVTEDWGKADPNRHNQYRIFGSDIEQQLPSILSSAGILRVSQSDPVTATEDRAYIISKNIEVLEAFAETGWRVRFIHF